MTIRVVNVKTSECDVYIGRSSKWGNPFPITKQRDREQVIELYRQYLYGSNRLLRMLPELVDKTLGCHCAPLACHGDVIKETIELLQTNGWDYNLVATHPYPLEVPDNVFRVLVAGSRSFDNYPLMCSVLDRMLSDKVAQGREIWIVNGTANGADALGGRYAKERGYKADEYPAAWELLGKAAGHFRNAEMAEVVDAGIVFMEGRGTPGSKGMWNLLTKKDIPRKLVLY